MATKKGQGKTVKKAAKKKAAARRTTIKKGSATKKTTDKKRVTKKQVHKKARAKTVRAKTSKKQRAMKKSSNSKRVPLVRVEGGLRFWVHNGQVLGDLVELKDALAKMDKETFLHHVNAMKNDFAVWVKDVLDDAECARDIAKSKTAKTMVRHIEKALKKYIY